jgi:hypothetical protein
MPRWSRLFAGLLLALASTLPSGCCASAPPLVVRDESPRPARPLRATPRRDLSGLVRRAALAPSPEERDEAAAALLVEIAEGQAYEERLEEALDYGR